MSERAQKVLELLRILIQNETEIWLRQATLAEHFGCSRTTIWRAIKQLKEAGLITDLNKRHEHRYKIYRISFEKPKKALTPAAQHQWKHYGQNFQDRFEMFDGRSGRPKLEDCFAEVTWELEKITDEAKLYEQIFAKLKARPEYQEAYRSHWCETYPDLDPIYMNCVLRYGKPLP